MGNFCPTFYLDSHAHRVNCRRNREGRSAVRRTFVKLAIISQPRILDSASSARAKYVISLLTGATKLRVSTADPHSQSGVGKSSLINRVFRLENAVRAMARLRVRVLLTELAVD